MALATGVKLWPITLAPMLLRRQRWREVASYLGVGAVLMLVIWWQAGVERLVSPLAWQQDRGLQMESVAATPLMLLRLIDNRYQVFYSDHLAMEVSGPRLGQMLTMADLAFMLGLLVIAAAFGFWLWRGAPVALVPGLAVFAVAVLIVTGKTLSPQYLLWLSVLVPIWWASVSGRAGRWLFVMQVAVAALTTIVFPIGYGWLREDGGRLLLLTGVLATRNLLLCALTVYVGWWLVRQLRRAPAAK